MTDHLITPPPELVTSLRNSAPHGIRDAGVNRETWLIHNAYALGADQELEACCLELVDGIGRSHAEFPSCLAEDLRAARRPKPPSLKEEALKTLQKLSVSEYPCNYQEDEDWGTIRHALEALPE